MNILTFENYPIFEQLRLEESLLKGNHENWAIINMGSPKAIVLGISSKPEEVVNTPLARNDNIPLIQRFTGGGTVIVDEDTIFVTFIFQKNVHTFELFPKNILTWAGDLFKKAWDLPNFELKGNDFTLGDKKIGGNAQYIKKDRFLHHTSFLWDFASENMSYLLHPPKEPSYRRGRPHIDFLTTLSPHLSKEECKIKLLQTLSNHYITKINPPLPQISSYKTLLNVL